MSDTQMIIVMPEEEKNALIDWWDSAEKLANEFTDTCISILVDKHGATRERVNRDVFFDSAIGKMMNGKEFPSPDEAVSGALELYWPHLLGMG